jgi:signal transduction histidine kinase
VDGRIRGIQTELARIGEAFPGDRRIERAHRYAQDASGLHSMYREALGTVDECDLHEVLVQCSGLTEWITAGDVTASVYGDEDVLVMANGWLLRQAFTNLLDNARLEIEHGGHQVGNITVQVRSRCEPPPAADGEAASGPWCVTEIEDDGPGLSDGTLEGLVGGGRQNMQPRGHGTGVDLARQWFAEYGGYLGIDPEPSPKGGARFMVWLPQLRP